MIPIVIKSSERLMKYRIGSYTRLQAIVTLHFLVSKISSIGQIKPRSYCPAIRSISSNFSFITIVILPSYIVIKERICSSIFVKHTRLLLYRMKKKSTILVIMIFSIILSQYSKTPLMSSCSLLCP